MAAGTNSESESDWDSMSEAPPAPQPGVDTRYPAPRQDTREAPPPQSKQPDVPVPPYTKPKAQPRPQPRPPSSQPPSEARARPRLQGGQQEAGREVVKQQKKVKNERRSELESGNNFSDLNKQGSYEDSGLGSSPEKGVDNRGYREEEDETGEKEEEEAAVRETYKLPVPEERISLLPFDEMRTNYLQVEFDDEGLLVDRLLPPLVRCCTRTSAELLGVIKLPCVVLLVILGQVVRVVTSSLLRPASDHLLKPLLVSLHNLLLSPVCSLLYNVSRMCGAVVSPCCPTSLPPPWRYVYREERASTINLNI